MPGKTMRLNLLFATLLLGGSFFSSFSQGWVNPEHTDEDNMSLKKGWYAAADLGTTLFYGDVSKYNYFPKTKDFRKSFASAFSLYGGKKFKHGMIAELQLSKGTLKGEKMADRLYPRYFNADYMDYSVNFKYCLSQQVFRKAQQRKFFNRISVYVTAGVGQVFFRSRLYKQAINGAWYLEHTNGYSTSGIDSAGINSAGGLVQQKKGMASALIIPIGGKLSYKLNAKTDINFDFRYNTALTDKLDSWERSWTHYDKYLYMGLGLTFNFGKTEGDDVPDGERYLKHGKKEDSATNGDVGKPERKHLFRKKSKSDKDTELRMKMYELLLMMFELQYMGS